MVEEESFRRSIDIALRKVWPVSGGGARHTAELRAEIAGLYAVYADWLEEQGAERATGYRWLAQHGKYPRSSGESWDWWGFRGSIAMQPEDLSSMMWQCLPGTQLGEAPVKDYPTPESAERALCKAIRFLGIHS
jgi:hypothetical protein